MSFSSSGVYTRASNTFSNPTVATTISPSDADSTFDDFETALNLTLTKRGLARASAQFDKTTDTTLADVTGLSINVVAGVTYQFEAVLFTTSNSSGGVKAAIAGTATATAIIYEAVVYNAAALAAQTRATALAAAVGGVTAVTVAMMVIRGLITVNAAGTLTIQFAQNASNGAASSVLIGSYLRAHPFT
jgi:hypothetical protein